MLIFGTNLSELLHFFFEELYNNDIVSDEAFEAWHSCDDPAEQESYTSLIQFKMANLTCNNPATYFG